MSLHTVKHTFEELGKNQQQRIETNLSVCYTAGCKATRFEPEEPSDIEIYEIEIVEFNDIKADDISDAWYRDLVSIVETIIDKLPYFKKHVENEIFGR
jgi:hypothetical protein